MKIGFSFIFFALISFSAQTEIRNIKNGFARDISDPRELPVSVITQKEADALFKSFTDDVKIPFKYPFDGCYARATAMAKIAEDKKIIMAKVFVEGNLIADTDLPEYPVVAWGWHVAPMLYVKNAAGKVEIQVFDPGLFGHPVPLDQWKRKMLLEVPDYPASITATYFGSRFQYFRSQKIPLKDDPNRESFKTKWHSEDFEGKLGLNATFEKYRPLQDFSKFVGKKRTNFLDELGTLEGFR